MADIAIKMGVNGPDHYSVEKPQTASYDFPAKQCVSRRATSKVNFRYMINS